MKRAGHPKFFKLMEECADLHERKNKQYASGEDPLCNFKRGSQICKKFFHPDIQKNPVKLAAAYCIILATKQIDGVIEIIAEDKKDTPDSISEKLRDVLVYFGIADCIFADGEENKSDVSSIVNRRLDTFREILRCKTCRKEMMPGFDDNYPLNCQTCKPEDIKAYREWQITIHAGLP